MVSHNVVVLNPRNMLTFWYRLSDDILMSRSQDVIITWHWLAFRRFFRVGQYEAIYAEPQRTDFNDSRTGADPVCHRF